MGMLDEYQNQIPATPEEIAAVYMDMLGREPTQQYLDAWTAQGLSAAAIADRIANSSEYRSKPNASAPTVAPQGAALTPATEKVTDEGGGGGGGGTARTPQYTGDDADYAGSSYNDYGETNLMTGQLSTAADYDTTSKSLTGASLFATLIGAPTGVGLVSTGAGLYTDYKQNEALEAEYPGTKANTLANFLTPNFIESPKEDVMGQYDNKFGTKEERINKNAASHADARSYMTKRKAEIQEEIDKAKAAKARRDAEQAEISRQNAAVRAGRAQAEQKARTLRDEGGSYDSGGFETGEQAAADYESGRDWGL